LRIFFFHELDVFIEDQLIPEYTIGKSHQVDKVQDDQTRYVLKEEIKQNPIIQEFPQLKEIISVLKRNKSILNKDANCYNRLHYVRYADNLLLGVVGNKEDCRNIISRINKFLQETLKLKLNLDKCSINLA